MLNRMNRKMSQKGFTLIELMIVVAIIGILAAIAIPNFRSYQLKAKRGELPTNLKAIKTAEVAFQAERDHFQALPATPAGELDGNKRSWPNPSDTGAYAKFANIGWQPSGKVYGAYGTIGTVDDTTVTGQAESDIDNDGTNANYTFTVDIAHPSKDHDVTMQSKANVF